MILIMLPNYCFKTQYQAELDAMKEANGGIDPVEINFSKEEIRELQELQR